MIRKPEDALKKESDEEDDFFIPTPTFECADQKIQVQKEDDSVPSLTSLCVHFISESLTLDKCIDALVLSDNI